MEMNLQFRTFCIFRQLFFALRIQVSFICEQYYCVFFIHEVAVKLCLLLLNEPLFNVQFAYVYLLKVECEDDGQGPHQVPFECSFKFEGVNQVLVLHR